MSFIDCHSHLADPRIETNVDGLIAKAQRLNIQTFVQGGIGPEDWQRQINLKKKYASVELCFGLHPYFVADHSDEECEEALDLLPKMLSQAVAIGEMGFDFRPEIIKDSLERQISIFEKQIEIAQIANKPMVLHIVRAHAQVMKCFAMWGVPSTKGMIHSFNGNCAELFDFLELGLFISVGGPICRSNNTQLHDAIKECPLEALLLETDSPDQPPPGINKGQNEPSTLIEVAKKVAEIKKIPTQEILDRSSQNARKLFKL